MSPLRSWITAVYRPYRKLKFRYKLSIYFTIFGLFIGYCSFAIYTHLAAKQMMSILSGVVDEWIASDTSGNDSVLNYINRPYTSETADNFPVLRFILNVLSQNSEVSGIAIYYFDTGIAQWFCLQKDSKGYIRIGSPVEKDKILSLEASAGKKISSAESLLPGKGRMIDFRVNLTKPGDRNIYIVEIAADRMGLLKHSGGFYIIPVYTLCLFIISLVISRAIALHISKPIYKLSLQASQIASGDLDMRTEIVSRDEIGDLSFAINTMADEIRDYLQDINERMEAISVMNQIDKAVLSSISREDLMERVTLFVSELFSDSYIAFGIADSVEKRYRILSQRGKAVKEQGDGRRSIGFARLGEELLTKNREFYILDGNRDGEEIGNINRITRMNFMHLVNFPVYIDDEYIGSFVAGKNDDLPFTRFEIETLTALADQVGVAMKSVRFVEEKERLYMGIIMSLSKAIDAKSKWTAGHSERVADYSARIAAKLGLADDVIRDIRMSAILHDIGKIGVPERVLDKPGRLTGDEYMLVMEHSFEGALIVSEIPGSRGVLRGILSHHESWDGKGYPFGLAGEEIPLIARIIAVADVFDSLVSDRPYRKGLGIREAVDFIVSEKGKRFDPRLVDIMVEIITE